MADFNDVTLSYDTELSGKAQDHCCAQLSFVYTQKECSIHFSWGGGAVYFLKCERALRIDPEVAKEDVYCETDPH